MNDSILFSSLCRYIGQTVTIFTTSGGISGCGFTGVLASVDEKSIKLITNIGAAPSCPIGSNCSGCNYLNNSCGNSYGYGGCRGGYGGGCGGCEGGYGGYGNGRSGWLGSVTEIPICKIASFTKNAINL